MKLSGLITNRRKAFTLIELLTVIAIIGILAGALSVVVPLVRAKSAQMDAANNCRQIALAYSAYSGSGSVAKNISMQQSGTVTRWATFLTKKNPEINNAKLWFIANDDRLAAVTLPQFVINTATEAEDPIFSTALPKSWAVVANAPRNADASYPLIWTRGLNGNTWDKQNSPWKGKGGHVGFMSGTVSWYDSTMDEATDRGIFIDYTTKQPTDNVVAALGVGAMKLEDN